MSVSKQAPNTVVRQFHLRGKCSNRKALQESTIFKINYRLNYYCIDYTWQRQKKINYFPPFMSLVRLVYSGFICHIMDCKSSTIFKSCLFKVFLILDIFIGIKNLVDNYFIFSLLFFQSHKPVSVDDTDFNCNL